MQIFIILALIAAFMAAGCETSSTSPGLESYSVEGMLFIEGAPNASLGMVRLFPAPGDETLAQILEEYSSVGFSPVTPMLYNPLIQTPAITLHPDSAGHFRFEGIAAGSYIIDAALSNYACPRPVLVNIPAVSNVGALTLAVPQLVSGSLGDAVWTTGTAYQLTGNVIIEPSSDLVIQSGVLVEIAGDFTFTVYGSIRADGVPNDPIRFRLTDGQFQSGGDWGGLRLDQPVSTCELTGMMIQGASTALRVIGGYSETRECLFDEPSTTGAYFSAGATGWLEHCIVRDGDQGLTADNAAPHFDHNVVLRMATKGITVKTNSLATIHGNVIMQSTAGIWSDWYAAPLVEYNLVSGGSYGLDAQSGFTGLVRYNNFTGQTVQCIYLHVRYCYPLVQNNNFLNAPATIFKVDGNNGLQSDTIWATQNYWDGEGAEGIPSRIIDGHDIGSPTNQISLIEYLPNLSNQAVGAGP
jgi:hypothetical protein